MSLKENMAQVKEELNNEEKLFESAVKAERFFKKYKLPLIVVATGLVVAFAGSKVYEGLQASKIEDANIAYAQLLKEPTNTSAKEQLLSNSQVLFDVFTLKEAIKTKDEALLTKLASTKAPLIADIAKYELANIKQDSSALSAYAYDDNAVLKDLAKVEQVVLLFRDNKIDEAKKLLDLIPATSPVASYAELLKHYGIAK